MNCMLTIFYDEIMDIKPTTYPLTDQSNFTSRSTVLCKELKNSLAVKKMRKATNLSNGHKNNVIYAHEKKTGKLTCHVLNVIVSYVKIL